MNIEYRVVGSWDADDFERLVNNMLREGWRLQGGVSIAYSGSPPYIAYVQAVVRQTQDGAIETETKYNHEE